MPSPRIVLITGANGGLGLQTVRALAASAEAYHILVTGRSAAKVQAAIRTVEGEMPGTKTTLEALTLDIEDDSSIAAAASYVERQFGRLDVLVNNAGAQADFAPGRTPRQVFEQDWAVNVTGAHLLTDALAPLLAAAKGTLIFLASGTGSLADTALPERWFNQAPPAGFPKEGPRLTAYRAAKTGLNMVMREWHRLLRNDGVQVYSVAPGFLATGLGWGDPQQMADRGAGDVRQGGDILREVIEGRHVHDVGTVVARDQVQPW